MNYVDTKRPQRETQTILLLGRKHLGGGSTKNTYWKRYLRRHLGGAIHHGFPLVKSVLAGNARKQNPSRTRVYVLTCVGRSLQTTWMTTMEESGTSSNIVGAYGGMRIRSGTTQNKTSQKCNCAHNLLYRFAKDGCNTNQTFSETNYRAHFIDSCWFGMTTGLHFCTFGAHFQSPGRPGDYPRDHRGT